MSKADWKTLKFENIACNIADRIQPDETNSEYYVGLEHLDPESLKIRRWGHPTDVSGQKLVIKKGDIVFGRRRAYQRKLGIADFDGICSAHAMVLRPVEENVIPEFLPFFLQSDMFMNRAVEISVGSLSPTINWKTMKVQEFPLPPKEEQRRNADLLWSVDETIEKWNDVLEGVNLMQKSILKEGVISEKVIIKRIDDFGKVVTGKTPPTKNRKLWDGDILFVTPADMSDKSKFVSQTERYITEEAVEGGKEIPIYSLLVTCIASIGKLAINTKPCITNQQINVVICNNRENLEYLYYLLRGKPEILKRVAGSSVVPIIKKSLFEKIEIPFIDNSDMRRKMVETLSRIDEQKAEISRYSLKTKEIQKQIINQIFG